MRFINTIVIIIALIFISCNHNRWNGFKRENFTIKGYQCILVNPENPNHKWIWRTYFFGQYASVDSMLLKDGYTLAFIDMPDMFGSPKAMSIMNVFYDTMIARGYNKRVVLEGFSRGGIYAFNWAANDTSKVACIYGDAPVLDLTTWPTNKNIKEWNKLKTVYGFNGLNDTETNFFLYSYSPINSVAIFKNIPIILVYGTADTTVPYRDNSERFIKLYQHFNGVEIKAIPKENVGHHPHSFSDPIKIREIVDFIKKHS